MTKTARELNIAHEMRQMNRTRPSAPSYNFAELEQIVNGWVRANKAEDLSPFATVNS